MNDKARFNVIRAEVEKLQALREHMRKQELMFKDMNENGYEKSETFTCSMDRPEYKIEQLYKILGRQLASKLDEILTIIEEHDTNN